MLQPALEWIAEHRAGVIALVAVLAVSLLTRRP